MVPARFFQLPSLKRLLFVHPPKSRPPPVAAFLYTVLHFCRRRRATLSFIFLLTWVFLDLDAYPVWWLSWLLYGPPTADEALSHNCTKTDRAALRPLVVVVPLIASQLLRVDDALARWVSPSLAPCSHSHQPVAHLSFFLDRAMSDEPTARSARELRSMLQRPRLAAVLHRCFAHVSIAFANLSREQSTNSHSMDLVHNLVITGGSNNQFESAIHYYEKRFSHMLLVEPDVYSIRAGWVEQALEEAKYGTFWQRGATMRYAPRFNIGFAPFRARYQRHINGNGLYRLSDRCFDHYRYLVRKRYGSAAYDVAMCQYRLSIENLAVYQATAHRFQVSPMIVAVGVTRVDEDDLRNQFEEALLVHGKAKYVPFPALNVMQY
ncbi:hypothetical protein BWQ96_05064 [Gracilariopsis chorda]|uniref:Uncharacterized protein n=1 Tax=Gracilariopsis chorda TaxID=448386 RepID=A0A2V3ISR4_9FLOR|nr:hypothetical protein BWQ96_05064 [Gracilariopsis chorda]|eukprot:PXF45163.1 hypothetical protein BWQ96_05064 [Gracilariopsis chorda]